MPEHEVGLLAITLFRGYMAHTAMSSLLAHDAGATAIGILESENSGPAAVPVVQIERKDGTAHVFDMSYALRGISREPSYVETYKRLWLAGSLITLGDRLKQQKPPYFDRGPDLELVRHLRNGVGHGNRFELLHGEPRRPAHFTFSERRLFVDEGTLTASGNVHTFEVTSSLDGQPVLFDFMGPGDICDLLQTVGTRLIRIGYANGDPPAPVSP